MERSLRHLVHLRARGWAALGLDHTGGPNANQPLRLRRTGQVFTPEAVVNPFALGGEKRSLFPLDLASLRQLYRRVN